MSTYEVVLVQHLLRQSFGAAPSVIACLLLQKESTLLTELVETSKLGWKIVRNSLLVLLKHGIVDLDIHKMTTDNDDSSAPSFCTIKYSLNMDVLMARLRFPKFLLWAEARYGKAGRLLLLQVLKNGAMKASDMIDGALEDYKNLEALIGDPSGNMEDDTDRGGRDGTVNKHRLQELLGTLVVESVLARVDSVDDLMKTSKPKSATKRPPPEAKGVKLRGETGKQAPPVVGRAPPVRKRRASAKKNATSLSSSAVVSNPDASDNTGLLFGSSGPTVTTDDHPKKKRNTGKKDNATPEDEEPESASSPSSSNTASSKVDIASDAVFRANLNFLNLEIFKQTIENFISLRWSNMSLVRMITRTLLSNARRSGYQIVCVPMNFEQLCQGINESLKKENKLLAAQGLPLLPYFQSTKILQSLDGLDKHKDRFVKRIRRDNSETYVVDWPRVAEILRHRLVTQVITTRYGLSAARVYSLTLDAEGTGYAALKALTGGDDTYNDAAVYQNYSRFWNDNEISELGLVSPQTARRHLAELADAGFLRAHLADAVGAVPASATAPTMKHCFVYGTREDIGTRAALTLCYQMCLNVLERKAVEVEKLQKVALKPTQLSAAERYEQKLRELAEDSLEASLFAIDQGLMIVRDL
eukprot:Blabericola_migrator_1__6391@NODE_321_length_9828_cov_184_816720_g260_i0_p3_GENE_NODE_321_length_9828_cov_184_816720_g260_i0NODE_321_length_9828_cov_184_816720_g260_i0_p3_ORF_typecomplete_len642_score134_29HTH_9/PF08221_11/6_6e09HTH_9/PF08221_11/9_6e02RNA_pol_Rpc82/PF05645_13/0_00057RNA_pol_Rpc82/PF05645_13/0_6TFIIE_alpha/PF02002_17/0_043TFIIE_alpha/PF02002_17/4_1e03TFIIE_alpha/PF02002_17/1_8e03TFIIE_alpha/PF02002_17/4_9e03TFIIE_alpha/PF02002_17/81HTH_DeoR/PF08220_12/0_0012HTH_20/PF12840_7/6_6e0